MVGLEWYPCCRLKLCYSLQHGYYSNSTTFVVSLYILSAGIATDISVRVFSFLFLIITSGLFAVTSVIIIIIIAVFSAIIISTEMIMFIHKYPVQETVVQ